jgi:spore maturation protein SpmB
MSDAEYDFTADENAQVGKVAFWAKVMSVAVGLGALETLATHVGLAAVHVAVAAAFWWAGGELQKVVDTEGDDIAHFLGAVDTLGHAFLARLLATAMAGVIATLWLAFYVLIGLA